jgi:alpha-beta hydrolase superfamily lysophospholipase
MEFWLRILSLVVLIYLGICVVYFLFQERFIFVPSFSLEGFNNKLASEVKEYYFQTPHQGQIHALLLKVENPKGVIFYLHGNTGSLQRWQFMAEELSGYGFDVFVMDYRGYGRSKGPRSEARMHRDAEYCYDWVAENCNYSLKIIYGRSLGSGFAIRLASRRKANALVLETPFFNLADVAKSYLPIIPVRFLLRYKFRNDLHLPHVDCPIQLFHGTKDLVVRYESALRLFRKTQEIKDIRFTTLVGGKHGNLNTFPLFREQMRAFFSELLLLNSHRD